MRFRLEIKMENAAFMDSASAETARILRKLAQQLEDAADLLPLAASWTLRDINGNEVGYAGVLN